jgi:hypothetical protein
MRYLILFIVSSIILFSCKKNASTPAPLVDEGLLGGTYTFKSYNRNTQDTTVNAGFLIATYRNFNSTNCAGTLTITKNNLKADGLVWNYMEAGSEMRTNLTSNASMIADFLTVNGSTGATTTSYSSNYTFSIAGTQLEVNDAQYIFCPAFQIMPIDKKYNYTLVGNDLSITISYYNPVSRSRYLGTAVFRKN